MDGTSRVGNRNGASTTNADADAVVVYSTDSTATIQAKLNGGSPTVLFKAGTFNIGNITVPSTVKSFLGRGDSTKFVGVGSLAANSTLIQFNSLNGFSTKGFSIEVDKTAYPTVSTTRQNACQNGRFEEIYIQSSGGIAVVPWGCTNVTYEDIQVDAATRSALVAQNGCQNLTLTGIRSMSGGNYHAIQIIGGSDHTIRDCYSYLAGMFGVNLYLCSDSSVEDCETITNTIEGINLQDCYRTSVLGNTVKCLTGHHDFGLSLYGAAVDQVENLVEGNRIYHAGKAGIALASSSGFACKQNHVLGNLIISPNQLNEAFWGGITLYGSALCTENTVQGNRLVDVDGHARYSVNEYNDGNGAPTGNFLIDNPALVKSAAYISENSLLSTGSQAWDLEKTAYVPTITAQTGTITTASATCNYTRRGKFATVDMTITITTNGTGGGYISATLPFSCVGGALSGIESVVSGASCTAVASGSNLLIRKYDSSYPGVASAVIKLSGILELA